MLCECNGESHGDEMTKEYTTNHCTPHLSKAQGNLSQFLNSRKSGTSKELSLSHMAWCHRPSRVLSLLWVGLATVT
jgi:chorismate synthase